jgi:hypothetical protein
MLFQIAVIQSSIDGCRSTLPHSFQSFISGFAAGRLLPAMTGRPPLHLNFLTKVNKTGKNVILLTMA